MAEGQGARLGRFAVAELSRKIEEAVRRIHLHGPHEAPGGLTTEERTRLHARVRTLLDHEATQADRVDALLAENTRLRAALEWIVDVPWLPSEVAIAQIVGRARTTLAPRADGGAR